MQGLMLCSLGGSPGWCIVQGRVHRFTGVALSVTVGETLQACPRSGQLPEQQDTAEQTQHLEDGGIGKENMYTTKMKVVQTFGSEWIEILNTLRNHHAKAIFI